MSEFDAFEVAGMDEKDELIEPVDFRGPGQCPNCGSQLVVADMEVNLFTLSPAGRYADDLETYVECTGVCPKCGKRIELMRINGAYKPRSELVAAIEHAKLQEKVEEREKKDNLRHSTENPFAY